MITTTYKLYPYRSLYGFDSFTLHLDNEYGLSSPAAEEWLHRITCLQNHIHNILKPINHKGSTLHAKEARQFNVADWVLVDGRNLQLNTRHNNSLTRKWLRPYEVREAIASTANEFKVPNVTWLHNIVHTTLFKLFERQDQPQHIDKNEEEIWQVEEIINWEESKELYNTKWGGKAAQGL